MQKGLRTRVGALALSVALVGSLLAPAAASANDISTANAFPGSGGLMKQYNSAEHVVYAVDLNAGDWIVAYSVDAAAADVDGDGAITDADYAGSWTPVGTMKVFASDAADINATPLLSVAPADGDWLEFEATTSGRYYFDFGPIGSRPEGAFTGMFLSRPSWSVTSPKTVITTYGAKTTIKGTLSDSLYTYLAGWGPQVELTPNVYLGKSSNGTSGWAKASGDYEITDPYGRFQWTVAPTSKTYYQLAFFGWADWDYGVASAFSENVVVWPRAYLSKRVPTSAYVNRSFAVTGYIKPRKTAGTYPVRIQAKKVGSSKVYAFRGKASNYSSYSSYKAYVKLPSKGKWQVRTYFAGDSKNYSAATSWSTITIK